MQISLSEHNIRLFYQIKQTPLGKNPLHERMKIMQNENARPRTIKKCFFKKCMHLLAFSIFSTIFDFFSQNLLFAKVKFWTVHYQN